MKPRILSCLLFCPVLALAESAPTVVEVPVVAVEPLLRTVTERIPHESCWDERVRVVDNSRPHSATPTILGAILGGSMAGVLGRNSRHQPLIAGAGAVLGASMGHDRGHRNSPGYYVTERRCEVDYELREREEVTGYRVSYRYGGTIHHTRTSYHPGDTLRVQVVLQPL